MTIPSPVSELGFATNGTSNPFNLTSGNGALYFENGSDLVVWYVPPTGDAVLWNYGTDYTVSGDGKLGLGVLTPIAANENGGILRVSRATQLLQTADYVENDGFPADTHERVADRGRLIDQDQGNALRRTLRLPIHEEAIGELPKASDRLGKYQAYDAATGAPVLMQQPTITVTAEGLVSVTTVLAMKALAMSAPLVGTRVTLSGYYADQDSGEARTYKIVNVDPGADDGGAIIASDTAGYWFVLQHVPKEVDVRWWGAVLDDAADHFAAFKNALVYLNARGYGTLLIPGKLAVASASWAAYGTIAMTAAGKIKIKGTGRDHSRINITGATSVGTAGNGITFENCGEVAIANIEVSGNNTSVAGFSTFLLVHMTNAAAKDMPGVSIKRCRFRNFQQNNWIRAHNTSATKAIRNIHIDGNDFVSLNGNSLDPANIGETSTMIGLGGVFPAGSVGIIADISVRRNTADGRYVKRFVDCWAYSRDAWIENNDLLDFGQVGANDDKGAYALMAYQQDGSLTAPDNINFCFNRVRNPRSCGLYVAATGGNVNAIGNKISGQTDTQDATLPKAAIAYNEAWGKIAANTIEGCYGGIWCNGNAVQVSMNSITGTVANAYGIVFRGHADGATMRQSANDNDIALTGAGSKGYVLDGRAGTPLGYIQIKGGRVAAAANGIFAHDNAGGGVVAEEIFIAGVALSGTCSSSQIAASSSAAPIRVHDVVLDAADIAAAAHGLNLAASTDVDIDTVRCLNKAAGSVPILNIDGCRGRMRGVQFDNVALTLRRSSADFGVAKPTWTAKRGTFIQNIDEAQNAGAAITGWANDDEGTTWTTRTVTAS